MNSRRQFEGGARPINSGLQTLTASRPLAPHNSNRAFRHGFALSVTIKSLSWSPDAEKFTHCTAIARRVNSAEARRRGSLRLVLARRQGVSSRSRKTLGPPLSGRERVQLATWRSESSSRAAWSI